MDTPQAQRVVLISGPSGAGRSSAINVLEDLGYETIDNMPLSLAPQLIDRPEAADRPLALGLDVRNREFSTQGMLDLLADLRKLPGFDVELLYLDCAPDILARRYSETRRRHPLAPQDAAIDGITREILLLEEIRARADMLVDTTHLSVHDLRAELEPWFAQKSELRMALAVHSFSYKRGLPHGIDMIIDCRFLRNPHWEKDLRALTGLDEAVSSYVEADPNHAPFQKHVLDLLRFVLPQHRREGKAHFAIGFGCTGGQHRSVTLTESVGRTLADEGWRVSIRHRELERQGLAKPRRLGPANHAGRVAS